MSAQQKYDCAIVGGGLGGLTLAIQLAQKGRSVVLLEKESYPFHRVCGEYIAMESWGFLERLGLNLSGMNLPRITNLHVSSPNGNLVKQALEPGGFGISRYTIDFELAKLARAAGVTLLENTKVNDIEFNNDTFTVRTNGGNYEATMCCGAYGKKSNIDIKLKRKFVEKPLGKINNVVGAKYHIRLDFPDNLIELHNYKDGYCGISKVDGDKFCICYLTTAKNFAANNNSIEQLEEKEIKKNPYLKKYFNEAEFLFDKPVVISQVNFSKKTCIENHVIMVGDTAGLIAPLCGNGMSMAMNASKILAGLLELYFKGDLDRLAVEAVYTKTWQENFTGRLFIGRTIQSLFGNEALTNLFIGGMKPFPGLVRRLIKSTHGQPF
ncbi:MAG: NAD(P)/FAD-dependent oxidoreductase [Bacteroidia bacterium]